MVASLLLFFTALGFFKKIPNFHKIKFIKINLSTNKIFFSCSTSQILCFSIYYYNFFIFSISLFLLVFSLIICFSYMIRNFLCCIIFMYLKQQCSVSWLAMCRIYKCVTYNAAFHGIALLFKIYN